MKRAVTLNGLETEWLDIGDPAAQPLLCLHPLGQNTDFFLNLAQALGPDWRVVSFDQRGHGSASGQPVRDLAQFAADAAAALDRLGGRAHLVGFSLGGTIAALLAAQRPRGILSLTLAATPQTGLPIFAERACAVEQGGIEAVTAATIARWFGSADDVAAIAHARNALSKLRPEGFDAAWRAFADFQGYREIAARFPATLCLSFADDLSTPPDVLDGIAGQITAAGVQAARVNVEGAGHMGLLQKPREVAAAIAAHAAASHAQEMHI